MAKGSTVLVYSKLPNSLILNHPIKPEIKVTLFGTNSSRILDGNGNHSNPTKAVMVTEVDKEFWDAWFFAHNHSDSRRAFAPLASGAIYVAKNEADGKAIEREFEGRLTGLEPMRTDGKDARAPQTKKATDD